jgi:HEAT repeat protein
MAEQVSPSFQRFTDSLEVTGRESLESYDLNALFALEGQERDQAEQILIERLIETNDPRAPKALRQLGSEKALPALRRALVEQSGEMQVEVANTLWSLTREPSSITAITGVLQNGELYDRVNAAFSLRNYPPEAVKEALLAAIEDDDKLVRANAVDSLFLLYGLNEWEQVPGRGISLLGLRLRSAFPSVRQEAVKELRAIIQGKQEGKSPQELGITTNSIPKSEEAVAFLKSIAAPAGTSQWQEDFDLEALGKLQGEEKEWAEYSLLNFLEKRDFRAVRALVYLNCPKAVKPLQEVDRQSQNQSRFTDEVTKAIRKLKNLEL